MASGARSHVKRRAKSRSQLARDFYAGALDAAERIELDEAAEIEGLDGEIAVLRMRLRQAAGKRKEDFALLLRGVDLLVKAVCARYRLSPEAGENLGENIAAMVQSLTGLMPREARRGE